MDDTFEFYAEDWIDKVNLEIVRAVRADNMLKALGFVYPAMKAAQPINMHKVAFNSHLKLIALNQPNVLNPHAAFKERYAIMNKKGGAWNLLKQWYLVGLLSGALGDFNMTANAIGGLIMTARQLESEALFETGMKYVFSLCAQMMRDERAWEQLNIASTAGEELVREISKYSDKARWFGVSVVTIFRYLSAFCEIERSPRNKASVRVVLEGYASSIDEALGNNFHAAGWIDERLDEI